MSVVRYRVRSDHRTNTVHGEKTLAGSVHHPEIAEFTGLITQSHGDGTHDLVIFPPGRPTVHVAKVHEGDGDGCFTLDRAPPDDLARGKKH